MSDLTHIADSPSPADAAKTVSSKSRTTIYTCSICRQPFPGPSPDHWSDRLPIECSACRETRQMNRERERLEECERLMAERELRQKLDPVERYHRHSHFGRRLERARFESFDVTEQNQVALSGAREWQAMEDKPNLIIAGPVGSGKSHLAACLLNVLIGPDNYVPCLWLSVATYLAEIKQGFHDDDMRAKTNHQYRLAQEVPILFLDDLGKTHPSRDISWVEDQLYGIVDARYRELLPTVVTTEWKSDALAERVGTSVLSRLIHGAIQVGIGQPTTPYRRIQGGPR